MRVRFASTFLTLMNRAAATSWFGPAVHPDVLDAELYAVAALATLRQSGHHVRLFHSMSLEPRTTMATYVLVHGGGHGGWCYRNVKHLLERAGHEVFAPSLTGLAERSRSLSPDIDLDFHIDDVVELLRFWDVRDAIVVGHSYGGMVITGVGDRVSDRVGKLVYLDAANPQNGQSLVDVAGPVIEVTRPMGTVVDGVELVLLPAPGAAAFYGVDDADDQVWTDARLTGHPWRCFEQKLLLVNEDALAAIPQFHIVCTSTLPTRDRALIDQARADGRLWEIDTGHDVMITEPAAVADALLEIASR
jgi:pimeloyl-ACP methyl ester carboxylesterase